jgi:oligopeptide/dipeptide ABC transporter ATP-binding protein
VLGRGSDVRKGAVTPPPTEPNAEGAPILEVRNLRTYFYTRQGIGRAVDGVSFTVRKGETLGLVGESGCGKSMTCLSIVRLNPKGASRIVGGQVLFDGIDLLKTSERNVRFYRGRHIAMILQDSMTALNPVFTIGEQLYEPLRRRPERPRGAVLKSRAVELLRLLQIPAPETRLANYPHQFSGGMRQRVVGAIALSSQPEVIIADEPTTALDVTVQAAYLNLLRSLQSHSNLAIIFVTHDFGIVARMCDRVAVMYAGRIVESASTSVFFSNPGHPYSEALLRSVPDVNARADRLYSISGQPPSIFSPPSGCRFHPRCPLRSRLGNPVRCELEEPALRELAPGHLTACHFAEENLGAHGAQRPDQPSIVQTQGQRPSGEAP